MATYLNGELESFIPASYSGARVTYDNTSSGMTATNMQDAVDELNSEINKGYVQVTSDGVKTWSQMFDSLYALIDRTKLTHQSVLIINTGFYRPVNYQAGGDLDFCMSIARANALQVHTITLKSSGSVFVTDNAVVGGGTMTTDNSSNVPSSGVVFTIFY